MIRHQGMSKPMNHRWRGIVGVMCLYILTLWSIPGSIGEQKRGLF